MILVTIFKKVWEGMLPAGKEIKIRACSAPGPMSLIGIKIPLFVCRVQAVFPSPADDYIENYLDLNSEFIKHPSSTFFLRASGESMKGAGMRFGPDLGKKLSNVYF